MYLGAWFHQLYCTHGTIKHRNRKEITQHLLSHDENRHSFYKPVLTALIFLFSPCKVKGRDWCVVLCQKWIVLQSDSRKGEKGASHKTHLGRVLCSKLRLTFTACPWFFSKHTATGIHKVVQTVLSPLPLMAGLLWIISFSLQDLCLQAAAGKLVGSKHTTLVIQQ